MRVSLIGDVAELYEQYHRQVYAYLLRLSCSADWAEDLLQETFYRAIRGAATYRGEASPLTWLCTIGRRLYLTQVKRRSQEQRHRVEIEWDHLPSRDPGPEAVTANHEDWRQIQRVLDRLPEAQHLALLLRDWDGLPYETIAQLMGLSLANVKVTIHRARTQFRTLYRTEGSDSHET